MDESFRISSFDSNNNNISHLDAQILATNVTDTIERHGGGGGGGHGGGGGGGHGGGGWGGGGGRGWGGRGSGNGNWGGGRRNWGYGGYGWGGWGGTYYPWGDAYNYYGYYPVGYVDTVPVAIPVATPQNNGTCVCVKDATDSTKFNVSVNQCINPSGTMDILPSCQSNGQCICINSMK